MQLSTKHLLGIKELTSGDISSILATATNFKEVLQRPIKKVPSLRDVTIVNLFMKTVPVQGYHLNLPKKDSAPTL